MTSAEDGDAPNCGANDGTQLLPLTNSAYRDFRPAIQLAAVLFEGRRAYDGPPELDAPAAWLGVDSGVLSAQAPCTQSDAGVEGGFATLSVDNTRTVLRVPRFRFRPSQADALHLDVWIGADNVLRDGGTYSYNSGQNWIDYFGGTRSHNTIQFDERDQMPRLSRFLFGKWLSPSFTHFDPGDGVRAECAAGYVDFAGACHARYVNLRKGLLTVEDRISGFRDKAVLRWRLVPGEWRLEGNAVTNDRYQLAFTADVHIFRTELTRGWESRHYLEMTQLPVLEVEVREPGAIRTMFSWAT